MERFRRKPCPEHRERVRVGDHRAPRDPPADTPAGECGAKDQVSRAEAPHPSGRRTRPRSRMDLTFTARGLPVSDEVREQAQHKLSRLGRLEPRVVRYLLLPIPMGEMTKDAKDDAADKLRVMIVDDHALFRRGLEMVLQSEDDLMLVGEASDGEEAVEKAQELMPDVVLMDVRMPKRSGIEAAGHIKDLLPHAKILMLTISDDEGDLYDAIKAGAAGYLLKEIPIEEVADAIRSVWAGQSRISPSMASKLLTEFAAMSKASDERPQMPAPRLTEREMEVLKLVAQGLNNRDIAKKRYISENTVKNHIRNILEKLHLHSRMEAVVYAVREKMIEIT